MTSSSRNDITRAASEDDGRRSILSLTPRGHEVFAPLESAREYVFRAPRAGDMGWVVQRHGAVYASEYGWDERFSRELAEDSKLLERVQAADDKVKKAAGRPELGARPVTSLY